MARKTFDTSDCICTIFFTKLFVIATDFFIFISLFFFCIHEMHIVINLHVYIYFFPNYIRITTISVLIDVIITNSLKVIIMFFYFKK